MFVPAKLRGELGETFFVTIGTNGGRRCLTVYTQAGCVGSDIEAVQGIEILRTAAQNDDWKVSACAVLKVEPGG